jgi:surfactin synthase thioesterase subunit
MTRAFALQHAIDSLQANINFNQGRARHHEDMLQKLRQTGGAVQRFIGHREMLDTHLSQIKRDEEAIEVLELMLSEEF